MKLFFSWEENDGSISPICSSDFDNEDGISLLCCLLTDDGGQRFFETVSWLDEGMNRVKSVRKARVTHADWSRDAWGVELTMNHAKIYSLHDEDYFEILNIESFEIALLKWRNFIQEESKIGATLELQI